MQPDGNPKLLDFGISKPVAPLDQSTVTLQGAMTPAYARRKGPARFGDERRHSDECREQTAKSGGRQRQEEIKAKHSKLRVEHQGAERPAKSAAGTTDAEDRDWYCTSAEREAKWSACKFRFVIGCRAVLPNPSVKRSANGRPPGRRSSAGLHYLQRRPGGLPSSPAYLKR